MARSTAEVWTFVPAANFAATVGGLMEMHYAHPLLGPVYSIRLAVTLFDVTPTGSDNDYLYTGAGGFTPGEAGVLATFANIAAVWAPYYDAAWSLELAQLYQNVAGVPNPLPVTPTVAPVAGTATVPLTSLSRAKRAVALFSGAGSRWRVWLRQLFPSGVGETINTSDTTGGIDARDQAWYGYVAGPDCALVSRDGLRFQAGGEVRAWWDTPPAPYLVSG